MANALFINGIYNGVMVELLASQLENPSGKNYLQPLKKQTIVMLRDQPPSKTQSVRLYLSTTENLNQICYTAEIIGWEDKRELSKTRRLSVARHLKKHQPGEVLLFSGEGSVGQKAVNLIAIRNLKPLESTYSTGILRKVSDDKPLKKRTRSGGWSEVYDLGDLLELPPQPISQHEEELSAGIANSSQLSDSALNKRLARAPKLPTKVQVLSVGYVRNPDVIAAVLRRANGICEHCKEPAPFIRKSDGSPYLEVHHWLPLSEGGEDTIENAAALCPNCHREFHYGVRP